MSAFNALVPKDSGGKIAAQALRYGSHPRHRLDVYQPSAFRKADRPEALPIILFIYGGSWQSGDRQGYGFVGRALADQGFLVVIPDYRLVPEIRYPSFLKDNADAFRWMLAHATRFGGDSSRVVIVGHSAGAYNAAMLALDPRWLGEDRSAVRGFVGIAGPYDFFPFDDGVAAAAFGHDNNPAATQPINFASRDDPPTLLLHGTGDKTVYPRNSQVLRDRLSASGADAQMKLYRNVGHVGILTAFARPFRGRVPVLADVGAFARKVVAAPTAAKPDGR